MISFPNCKINLGLSVIEKRADGFHNIESIFYPINWCDILEINKSDEFQFTQSGLNISSGTNLCVKAFNLIKEKHNIQNVKIHLHKVIPIGAGLGGGSSDAAFTIKTLSSLFDIDLSSSQMKDYAIQLGSDCPFFIDNKPMIATAKGEILKEVNIDLKNYQILIIFPEVFISTPEAFSGIIPSKKELPLSEIIKSPINNWKNIITNDFEGSIFIKYPQIKTIKDKLYEMGAVYASMSGSGSAVYGIFKKENKIDFVLNKNSKIFKYFFIS